jgi:hypothetical protein
MSSPQSKLLALPTIFIILRHPIFQSLKQRPRIAVAMSLPPSNIRRTLPLGHPSRGVSPGLFHIIGIRLYVTCLYMREG